MQDNRDGPPTGPNEKPSQLVIQCTRQEKGRYIAASRRRGMKLGAWVRDTLNKEAPPMD